MEINKGALVEPVRIFLLLFFFFFYQFLGHVPYLSVLCTTNNNSSRYCWPGSRIRRTPPPLPTLLFSLFSSPGFVLYIYIYISISHYPFPPPTLHPSISLSLSPASIKSPAVGVDFNGLETELRLLKKRGHRYSSLRALCASSGAERERWNTGRDFRSARDGDRVRSERGRISEGRGGG